MEQQLRKLTNEVEIEELLYPNTYAKQIALTKVENLKTEIEKENYKNTLKFKHEIHTNSMLLNCM